MRKRNPPCDATRYAARGAPNSSVENLFIEDFFLFGDGMNKHLQE